MKSVALTAYFSVDERNKEPGQEKNDKVLESPNGTFVLPLQGKDKFENDEVYVALFSVTGCTVHLSVSFPDFSKVNFKAREVTQEHIDERQFGDYLVC